MGILCSKDYTTLEWDNTTPNDIEIYDINQARTIIMNKSQQKHISDEDYNMIVKEKVNNINNMIEKTCIKLEEGVVVYTHNWTKINFVDEIKCHDPKERQNINMFYCKKLMHDIGKLYRSKGYCVSSYHNTIYISWK
jgi:hypothetical protein